MGGEPPRRDTEQKPLGDTDQFAAQRSTGLISTFSQRSWGWPFIVIMLAIMFGAGGFWLFKRLGKSEQLGEARFQRINVTKLTTNGNAIMAALSPDGKYLAYVLSDAGKQSLWLRQVAITSNVQLLQPRDGRYMGIAFSPDGNFVYFGYAANDPNDRGDAYRIPVLGVANTATRLDLEHGPASVSHDDKRISYIHYDRQNELDRLMVANKDGSGAQEITSRKWPDRFGWGWHTIPAWTANDEALTVPVVNSGANGFFVTIFEISLANRSNRIVPLSAQRFGEPSDVELLSDGSGIMLSAEAFGASFPQIWLLTRDGCPDSARLRSNLDAALAALHAPADYQVLDVETLPASDPRGGYPTPTVLYQNRDVFDIPEPPLPHPPAT